MATNSGPVTQVHTQTTATLTRCISKASELWFDHQPPEVIGCGLSGVVLQDTDPSFAGGFNAGQTINDGNWHATATELVMDPQINQTARVFTLMHELSHVLASTVAARLGIREGGLTNKGDEVLPDLIAAYLLTETGITWNVLLHDVGDLQGLVFDAESHLAGEHPPADERLRNIESLMTRLRGSNFETAARGILEEHHYLM